MTEQAGHDIRQLLQPVRRLHEQIRASVVEASERAREAGVVVTDVAGGPLRARLAVEPDVSWAGYANERIRATIEPLLHAALTERGLMDQD
jgi:hypothetical protein